MDGTHADTEVLAFVPAPHLNGSVIEDVMDTIPLSLGGLICKTSELGQFVSEIPANNHRCRSVIVLSFCGKYGILKPTQEIPALCANYIFLCHWSSKISLP